MDNAFVAAYDRQDLEHDFRKTKQGPRYTISKEVRREVLSRLLNHELYAEEVAQELHDKSEKNKQSNGQGAGRAKKGAKGKKDTNGEVQQFSMFD